ncbi:MAG: benzoate-CoA ligase family protein [Chloroflexi bacterium]|nr:benzoate-CoA ligase family protein [Chloroflexota bacterium]
MRPALALARRASGPTFNMATPLVDGHVDEGRGERPALRMRDRDISYAELQRLCNRAGNALRQAGVEPEQRVAIVLPDGAEFVGTFIGAMKIGAVPVPMNTFGRAEDLAFMLRHSRARAVVIEESLLKLVGDAAPARMFVVHEAQEEPLYGAASPDLDTYPTGVDEPCYWLYSSGTTGRPKAVVHLQGDMLACVTPYAEEVVAITPDDRVFSVPRLFFSYGLVNSLFLPLLAGASAVLTPQRPDAGHVLDMVCEFRPTLFFSVPSSIAQLCSALAERADRPFESLRFAISAGEPLPQPLYARWKALTGVEILDGLGSTEVGYIFCSNLPGRVRPGSSGLMLGDHQARIVDGELWVHAASTALHYWNLRDRSRQTFVGEWLRTGDRYRQDAEGYLWYEGRMDDVFKVNGQWVSPLEVESCLLEHPSVLECAVVAALDDAGLTKPKAFVVARSGADVSASELQALVRERLQAYKFPRWIEFVDELPKTGTGKVQRFRLRQSLRA